MQLATKSHVRTVTGFDAEIDLPPSVNTCWTNVPGKGRVRTEAYRRWHRTAVQEMMAQRCGHVPGDFEVVLKMGRPRVNADVDNRIKPILDMMSGLYTSDDRCCIRVTAEWDAGTAPNRARLIVRQIV